MESQSVSRRESTFKFLAAVFIITVFFYVYFQLGNQITKQRIKNNQEVLKKQNIELERYKQTTGYNKLYLIRELENSSQSMPWSEHIPKIISILEDLKSINSGSDSIILSDFKVNLNEISLKGKVSNLRLLYYNSPSGTFKSLIDRFEDLDFIENMEIKTYDKTGERYFEFVLNAKIKSNEK